MSDSATETEVIAESTENEPIQEVEEKDVDDCCSVEGIDIFVYARTLCLYYTSMALAMSIVTNEIRTSSALQGIKLMQILIGLPSHMCFNCGAV